MLALSLNSDWCLSVGRGLSGGNVMWEKENYVEEERDLNNCRMSLIRSLCHRHEIDII